MLKPLRAYRPEGNKAHLVPSRSVDSYSARQLLDKLENNPYSFLQVIRPETDLLLTNEERFQRIRERLDDFIEAGVFREDEKEGYFLYEQRTNGKSFTGLIGLLDVNTARIHLHENTLESRERLFADYLETTGFQAEPILVFGPSNDDRKELFKRIKADEPLFDFYTTNEIGHRLWAVDEHHAAALQSSMEHLDEYFLADGHHRYGSTCRVARSLQSNAAAQHILTMFMDESDLGIDSFERWVKVSSDEITVADFEAKFEVSPKAGGFDEVEGDLELFIEGQWFTVVLPTTVDRSLPPSYLMNAILEPMLGIKDAKTDKRITYIHQGNSDQSAAMAVNGSRVGFRLPPVSVEVLKKTALAGGTMPPKSTYIAPKLRSGMLLHLFK